MEPVSFAGWFLYGRVQMKKLLLLAVLAGAGGMSAPASAETIRPGDQCRNLPGFQTTVPAGHYQFTTSADGKLFHYCLPFGWPDE